MNKNKQAFTLVELIVVITILAILGTIAFISLQGYSASSRDSVRISDVSNMKTSLELFHLNAGKYPLPDDYEVVDYGSEILWYQGTLGTTVVSQLSRNMSEIPTDPLTEKEYVFSTTNNKNEFQILNLLEGDLAINTINKTNAATNVRIPRIDGQYNGVFVKTSTYIVPTPSIITAEDILIGDGLILNDTNITSQIITGGKNIPNTGNINSATGKLNIKLSVYSGPAITSNSSDTDKKLVMQAIQGAYTGSELANADVYKIILNTDEVDLPALVDKILLNNTSTTTTTRVIDTNAPTGGDFTMLGTTNTESITLTITCPTESGVEMYISGDITDTQAWESCITSKVVTLITGDGTKNITLKWRDILLNETGVVNKNIDLKTVVSGNDEYVVLLLKGDGVNGTNNIIDSSLSAHGISVFGDTKHSSTMSKFGGSSIYFDGTGDYLTIADSEDWTFGTNDWTVDYWANFPGGARIMMLNFTNPETIQITHYVLGGYGICFQIGGVNDYNSGGNVNPTFNDWHHIALVRNGGTITQYIDGISTGDTYNIGTNSLDNPSVLQIGVSGSGWDNNYIGYLDEIRVSKGIARWTDTFVPPTDAY